MKKFILNLLILVSFVLLFSAFKTKELNTTNRLFYLKKGLTYEKLDSMYSLEYYLKNESYSSFTGSTNLKSPNLKKEFEFKGVQYMVYVTHIVNADDYIFNDVKHQSFQEQITKSTTYLYDPFFLIFKGNKLFYWGYEYELINNDVEDIRLMAEIFKNKLLIKL